MALSPANQISEAVRLAKVKKGRAALVCFVTCGFPSPADSVPIMLALEKAGADVIELGIPFSDPVAEGVTIQYSSQIALSHGITIGDCLRTVREARREGLTVPVILMGYYNPLIAYGQSKVVRDAAAAGAQGFIVVDLPPEHSEEFRGACTATGMAVIPLIAPTSRPARIKHLCEYGTGFAYCIAVTGVTGARNALPVDLSSYVALVRSTTALPLCVGFGVSTKEHFDTLSPIADGIVIGSAIIKAISAGEKDGKSAADSAVEFVNSVLGQ